MLIDVATMRNLYKRQLDIAVVIKYLFSLNDVTKRYLNYCLFTLKKPRRCLSGGSDDNGGYMFIYTE